MKKILFILIAGVLLLGMTACGSMTKEKVMTKDKVMTEEKIMTGEKAMTAKFENSIFMGDSITEGFSINELLKKEQILAGAGATAGFSYEDIDALVERKPEQVFLMLGSDDILMPVEDPKELFHTDYTKLVEKIKEELPEAKIYLQSITPVTEEALILEPRYENIEEYNGVIQELAKELDVNYVEIDTIAKENPDLFAEDGVHFKKEFYQLWLEKLSKVF